ncbi:MAG TPA: hypothetical protein VGC39_02090, partial [Candidatus Methylacidiphilales bacterium]
NPPTTNSAKPATSKTLRTSAELQAAFNQLAQSNHDLLDLLKQQQTVLEDIQYDRRLQSRQIQSLEERLAEAQIENAKLQGKVDNLEAEAALRNSAPPAKAENAAAVTNAAPLLAPPEPAVVTTPAPPSPPQTYLPPPGADGAPGTKTWHRLFTLKGTDTQNTQLFHVDGQTWRVLWHNQDKDGKIYANTSALFINAFPKDDTIPQKVCSKLGTGGDSTELQGPGNYYLKIEGSGGSWELAVEDFR